MPIHAVRESSYPGRAAVVLGVLGLTLGMAACSNGASQSGTPVGAPNGARPGGGQASAIGSSPSSSGAGETSTGSPPGTPAETTADGGAGPATGPGEAGMGDDGSGEIGLDGAPPDAQHPDLGKGDGTDVILMGDSWMSNTLQIEGTGGGIAPALIQVAGEPYRNYAVQGVMMLQADSFGPAIPTQYESAKQANPDIKTVVMTGGGNDIIQNPTIQSDCQMGGDMCKALLMQISQALETLWTEMASDGVQDVVYIQYADNVGSTAQSLRGDAGVAAPSICLTGKIRCHSVDTTAAVMSQIAADGIHPLQAANQRIATQVYDLMVQDGMRR